MGRDQRDYVNRAVILTTHSMEEAEARISYCDLMQGPPDTSERPHLKRPGFRNRGTIERCDETVGEGKTSNIKSLTDQ